MGKQYSSIGGQALIEGVMMRGKKTIAIALRKADGSIEVKVEDVKNIHNSPFVKLPLVRGVVGLISSMVVGTKALAWSAEVYSEVDESYEVSKFEKWVMEKLGDKADSVIVAISMVLALFMAFFLFGALPTLLINFLKSVTENRWVLTTAEGVLKIGVFIAYIGAISFMKDIRRVFQYHGAEHKAIHCLENNKELTVENVKSFTTLHPRCGTSFLIIVLVVSIVIFSFVSWSNIWMRIGLKVLCMPLIAGIAYEIIKWAGRKDSLAVNIISYPGLMMQKLTTKEPDDRQIEVAIAALKKVLELEGQKEAC
jgi:uncharacterized protein YqhQ